MQLGRVSWRGEGRRRDTQMDMAAVEVVEKAVVDETEGVGESAFCSEVVGEVEGGRVDEGEGDEGCVDVDEDMGGCEEGCTASAGERVGWSERVEEETKKGRFSC